jgi:hypothetical protein
MMTTHCHRFFLLKHKEEGDNIKLVIVAFFAATPQKKTTMHCRHLLFL